MGVFQIIYIALIALGLGISLTNHGKPKTGNENFWTALVAAIVGIGILYGGGFFN